MRLALFYAPNVQPIPAGIFVGGASRRMGRAKRDLLSPSGAHSGTSEALSGTSGAHSGTSEALLGTSGAHSGETLLARTVRIAHEAGLAPVLVGSPPDGPLAITGVPRIDDAPAEGPLGGLLALLAMDAECVIALACDMPFVSTRLLKALRDAPAGAEVVLPEGDTVQPLCARYATSLAKAARRYADEGGRSLRGVVALAKTIHHVPADARELHDWDVPADMERMP